MSVAAAPRHPVLSFIKKWQTAFGVVMQDNLTYRGQASIWMLTDAAHAFLMALVWLASFNGRDDIRGFSHSGIILYYLVMLCLTNLMQTHIQWDISTEIREGAFSIYLTRPFSYMAFHYAGNVSWRIMRLTLCLPVILLYVLTFWKHLRWEDYYVGPLFWLAIVVGNILSYYVSYCLGMLAFFFTEVRGIYMFYYAPFAFLSGEMVPLDMLPPWMVRVAELAPFRYMLGFPVELFLNRTTPAETAAGFLAAAAWCLALALLARLLWRTGLKQYTGVGM